MKYAQSLIIGSFDGLLILCDKIQQFSKQMGQSICSPNSVQPQFINNPLQYSYGEDNLQTKIPHEDVIISRAKEIEYNLNDCQERLKKSQKLYKDPSMKSDPVILRSLSSKESEVKCTFERPYAFLNDPSTGRGKKYKIVDFADCKPSQIIIRDEVLQYFGVFLCFLAENPHLINEILLTEPNTYGIHALRMNIGSKKEFIFVDDYIICCDRAPLFSQPIKGIYMWPCLLEKAWFKVKGSIAKKIQKNSPEEVFNTFLSYPMKPYIMKPNDDQYNRRLLKSNIYNLGPQKGCIVTTKKEPLHKIGLSGRKHFYLLKSFDYQGKRLYYLRNPCYGSLDFRGLHRIISEEISAIIKELSGQLRISQGNFILDESEFIQQVQEFFIIHYTKSSQIISQEQITLDQNEQFFISTDLKNDGLVSICFSQQGNNSTDRPYFPLVYHVMSLTSQEVVSDQKNQEGCFGVRNTYLLDNVCQALKQGQYLIRLKKKRPSTKRSKRQKVSGDRIIITAPFKVKFDYKQLNLMKEKFNDLLKQLGRRQLHSRRSQIRKGKEDFDHKSFWLGDLAIVYVQKTTQYKKQVRVEVLFSELKNLECISHELKQQFTAMPPFQTDLLIIFQKIDLIQETVLGKYTIESF